MTADTAIRALRAATAAHEPMEADELASIVRKLNSLKPGSAEHRKLKKSLRRYADARSNGLPTGTVAPLSAPAPTKTRPSRADSARLAALRERADKVLGVKPPARSVLSRLTREQRDRYLGTIILEGEEQGWL